MTTSRATEDRARGRSLRSVVRRSEHGSLVPPTDRDPLGVLEDQHRSRLQGLIGVRIGRMLETPFTYYRGTAAQMAADLAPEPTTDLQVIACGDAHILNFGLFASPERALLFDLNDFDEAAIAPWEWDVKRLAASAHIGGRDNGFSEDDCRTMTVQAVVAYQTALSQLAKLSALDRYYTKVDTSHIDEIVTDPAALRTTRRAVERARRRTSDRMLAKITTTNDAGDLRIVDQPPITRHVDHATVDEMRRLFDQYRATLREDAAVLLGQFELVDFVLRVVGVGSVGTRCYVLLFQGPSGEALFLQPKEAQPSVLVTYGGMPDVIATRPAVQIESQGHRVVAAQRILQAQSDPFLGWIEGWAGERKDRPRVDYYWRQFRDMKGSIDLATLDKDQFGRYVDACARLLARGHSQSPNVHAIVGYLGQSTAFAEAISSWSAAYADVVEADHAALAAAVRSGRFPCETV